MIIGSGIPINHKRAPLPKPIWPSYIANWGENVVAKKKFQM